MKIVWLSLWIVLGLSVGAAAENWSNTNIQYLYSSNFSQIIGSDVVDDGKMETVSVEHAGGWDYGKNFFFVDMTSAHFGSGKRYKLYGEWIPKLSFSKISEEELSWGPVKDIYLAGEINQGDNFRVLNLGLGLAVDVGGFDFFDVCVYHRKDNFNKASYQLTIAWSSNFEFLTLPWVFEGFFDYYGTDYGTETISQPRLLLQGKALGAAAKDLQAGVELYYYHSSANQYHSRIDEAVPQLMLKWIW